QRGGELSLRLLEFGKRRGIVDELGCGLNAAYLRSRIGHPKQHVLLLLRVALHGGNQIRNKIGPALVLIDDFAPRLLDLLILRLNGVVAASAEPEAQAEREAQNQQSLHDRLLPGRKSRGSQIWAGACAFNRSMVSRAKQRSSHALALSTRLRSKYAG